MHPYAQLLICIFYYVKLQNSNHNGNIIVKQVNFTGNLILQILRKAEIRQIKLLQNCPFYVNTNGNFYNLAKLVPAKR